MKEGLVIIFFFFFNILSVSLFGQVVNRAVEPLRQDSVLPDRRATSVVKDTMTNAEIEGLNKEIELKLVDDFRPNPTKAVLYSAIFPGLGQIYNKKYWKLPIVYGGFLGVLYAVTWNGNMYTDYKKAYKDLMVDPYTTNSWHDFVADPTSVYPGSSDYQRTTDFLKRRRDYFRRNRDLAIIVGIGVYALCMIDAYVDAHLYNFTVTPDLSMTVAPVFWGPSNFSGSASVGFQCNIVF